MPPMQNEISVEVKTSHAKRGCRRPTTASREDSSRANALVHWGKCCTHRLHYVWDMLFEGTVQQRKELPLVEALIQAAGGPGTPRRTVKTLRRATLQLSEPLASEPKKHGSGSWKLERDRKCVVSSARRPFIGQRKSPRIGWQRGLSKAQIRILRMINTAPRMGHCTVGATHPPGTLAGSVRW